MTAQTWLITGVSSGFGRALAEQVLADGNTVVGTVRSADHRAPFEALGPGRAFAELLDVTSPDEQIRGFVDRAVLRTGRLDVLVNNAGYGLVGAVEETSDPEARHQMETNFFGPLAIIRAALPYLRQGQDEGRRRHIVNISSLAGLVGFPSFGVYNASKFALEGLSEALSAELRPFGISVTIVEPGAFRTDWAGRSIRKAELQIDEYEAAARSRGGMARLHGTQPGDPVRAARAIIDAVSQPEPPLRLLLGADVAGPVERKLAVLAADAAAARDLAPHVEFAPAAPALD